MTVRDLVYFLLEFDKDREVKLLWDGSPRGEVEAIYSTVDGKSVVIAGEWDQHQHDIALEYGMDFVPVYTKDKTLPCSVSFTGWPGARPPDKKYMDTPEGMPPLPWWLTHKTKPEPKSL